jgi:8-oxo-dGTP pyrophosphatase MutT (NUDIX family)
MISNGYEHIQFLLIQRKNSLSFIEFIRGKYHIHDDVYLSKLLRGMTHKEHHYLLTKTFPELWLELWGDSAHVRSHRSDYDVSERRYDFIAERIPALVRDHPSQWSEPEWGFPKGRRNPYENDVDCAVREFQEESGLVNSDFTILHNTHSISETFFGSNQVHYCHKYYIAICNHSTEVKLNSENFHMAREVGAIQWFSLDDAIMKIRPDNVEKREILLKAGKIMKNFHPVSTSEMSYQPRSI